MNKNEEEDCSICGLQLNEKFQYKLPCNHIFHYECLLKTFITNSEKDRGCPYCRKKTDYLPLVYGLKKVVPGIHCSYHDLKNKKEELKNYQVRCKHILTRGARKHEECGKSCQLGFQYCINHLKSNPQFKFDSNKKFIVKKQGQDASDSTEKGEDISQ